MSFMCLYDDGELADVTVVYGLGEELQAHKLVLRLRSKWFKAQLQSPSTTVVKLDDSHDTEAVKIMLQYICTKTVPATLQGNWHLSLKLALIAITYGVQGLEEQACTQFNAIKGNIIDDLEGLVEVLTALPADFDRVASSTSDHLILGCISRYIRAATRNQYNDRAWLEALNKNPTWRAICLRSMMEDPSQEELSISDLTSAVMRIQDQVKGREDCSNCVEDTWFELVIQNSSYYIENGELVDRPGLTPATSLRKRKRAPMEDFGTVSPSPNLSRTYRPFLPFRRVQDSAQPGSPVETPPSIAHAPLQHKLDPPPVPETTLSDSRQWTKSSAERTTSGQGLEKPPSISQESWDRLKLRRQRRLSRAHLINHTPFGERAQRSCSQCQRRGLENCRYPIDQTKGCVCGNCTNNGNKCEGGVRGNEPGDYEYDVRDAEQL